MNRLLAIFAAATLALVAFASGCTSGEPIERTEFRVKGDRFQINAGDGWGPFFPRGVNLSVGKPGRFPGELAATEEDYLRWLKEIAAMNADTVRIYTLHHPPFYRAFARYNNENPSKPLWLVQGIWLDEFEDGEYMTESTEQIDEEIRYVVDAVYGNADIGPRYGKAHGFFDADVSPWLFAWLPGHEMDGGKVEKSHEKYASFTEYDGNYIKKSDGKPIEAWVARGIDHVIMVEKDRYGVQHPVGWSNWPALDPIHHPTETLQFGQDVVDANLADYELKNGFTAGVFASYHIYPFNPEFIIYDPGYVATKDRHGKVNAYLGYLNDIVAAHKGVPLFVTEFGVPSSFGVAHMNPNAHDHGGYTEQEQAAINVLLYEAIVDSGCAGAVIFEWLDEWFKRTWMTNTTMLPPERGPMWWDVISPEENFGIKTFYPIPGQSVHIDGDPSDWPKARFVAGEKSDGTLRKVEVAVDPAFVFVHVELDGVDPLSAIDAKDRVLMIGFDTVDGVSGESKWPENAQDPAGKPLRVDPSAGLESVVILDPTAAKWHLVTAKDYDPTPRLNGLSKTGGVPESKADGAFSLAAWIINNDQQYIAAGGDVTPFKRYYYPGKLTIGDSETITTAHMKSSKGHLELRIPWHALWITDPSSRHVLYDEPATIGYDSRKTSGMRVVTAWLKRDNGALKLTEGLPANSAGSESWGAAAKRYAWPTWDQPSDAGERFKPVYKLLTEAWLDATPEPKL